MAVHRLYFVLVCLALLLVVAPDAKGEWLADGNPVTTAWTTDTPQSNQCVISDGQGGTIIVWDEYPKGVYAQRFSADGSRMWNQENGVLIWDNSGHTLWAFPHAALLSGEGKVLIVWQKPGDNQGTDDIYAQKIDATTGSLYWEAGGKAVCENSAHQFRPKAAENGLIVWLDRRDGSYHLYMNELYENGTQRWWNGKKLSNDACYHYDYQIAPVPGFSDFPGGSGGNLIVYTISEPALCNGVYYSHRGITQAQWVSSNGDTPWGTGGFNVLANDCISFEHPQVVGDIESYSRAYIVAEARAINTTDEIGIYAAGIVQASGSPPSRWTRSLIDNPRSYNTNPGVVMTGIHLVFTWVQGMNERYIYARKLQRDGVPVWSNTPIVSDYIPAYEHSIVASGLDRMTVTWRHENDIYARSIKISNEGPENISDLVLCSAPGVQTSPKSITDTAGGAFVAWVDNREDPIKSRIYTNRFVGPQRYCKLHVPKSSRLGMGGPIDFVIKNESLSAGIIFDHVDIYASYNGGDFMLIDSVDGNDIVWAEDNLTWVPWSVTGFISDDCRIGVRVVYNDNITAWDESESSIRIGQYSVDWAANGVPVDTEIGPQIGSRLIATSDNAYIVTWEGWDGLPWNYKDIFASKISSDGTPLWSPAVKKVGDSAYYRDKWDHYTVSDGAGGAIIVSLHDLDIGRNQLLAFHVTADGSTAWTTAVRTRSDYEHAIYDPVTAADGQGGAFIAWYEHDNIRSQKTYDIEIRIMHLNASGNPVSGWPSGGKVVFHPEVGVVDNVEVELLRLSANECLIAYTKQAYSDNIYLRRVSDSFTSAEFPVRSWSGDPQNHRHPCLVPDAADGFYVVWQDYAPHHMGGVNVHAQRIRPSGSGFERLWPGYGQYVCNYSGNQYWPRAVQDGAGGFVAVWHDGRAGDRYDIYAERVNPAGDKLWNSDPNFFSGVPVCEAPGNQIYPQIANVGGGLTPPAIQYIAAWIDERDLAETGCRAIFAGNIAADGSATWGNAGKQITGSFNYRSDDLRRLAIIADNENGMIIAWDDDRYAFPVGDDPSDPILDASDVRVQRIESGPFHPFFPTCESFEAWIAIGDDEWSTSDTLLQGCPQGDWHNLIIRCTFDQTGMEQWGWLDPADFTIVQNETPFGFCRLGEPDIPGTPANGYTLTLVRSQIRGCSGCRGESCEPSTIPEYNVPVLYQGIEIGVIQNLRVRSVDGTNDGIVNLIDFSFFSGAYNTVLGDANFNGCYDYTGDDKINLSDFSIFSGHYQHHDSCYPDAPEMMLGMESRIALHRAASPAEDDPNVIRVALKLSNMGDVTAAALTFEYSREVMTFRRWVPAPDLQDKSVMHQSTIDGKERLFLAAFAMDRRSDAADELGCLEFYFATVSETTVDEEHGKINNGMLALIGGEALDANGKILRIGHTAEFETPVFRNNLRNNYPNPFNPSTVIEYSLANDSKVEITVYNVKGQKVRTLVDAHRTKGMHTVVWDGRNNSGQQVASGVYFCRIKTDMFADSKKMILLR